METRYPLALSRLHYRLGRALSWCGWEQGADQAFRDALRLDPGFVEAQFHLAETLAAREMWKDASEAFGRAASLVPASAEVQANLVLALGRCEAWPAAAAALLRLIQLRPNQPELHLVLGGIERRRGRPAEAIRCFRWAVRLPAPPADRLCFLGEALFGGGEWAEIASCLGDMRAAPSPRAVAGEAVGWSALNVHPGAPDGVVRRPRRRRLSLFARRAHGVLLAAGAMLALAAPPARAEGPGADAAARACWTTAGRRGIEPCQRALALGLTPARASLVEQALAARLASAGRWDDVVALHRAAVARRPADPEAHRRLGAALLHGVSRAAEAEAPLREALRLRPEDAATWGDLALALAASARAREATAAFEQALRLEPGFFEHRPAARAAYDAAREGRTWPPPPSAPPSAAPSASPSPS